VVPGAPDPELVSASAMVFVTDLGSPVLDEATAHHVSDVLRLRPDEVVVASDGAGSWVRCRLSGSADRTLVVDGDVASQPGPQTPITVGFVPTKGARPEWVAQKLTELGVDRIVPLWSRRSVVRWEGERADRVVERMRRVVRESSAQCRRTRLPEVSPVMGLEELAALAGTDPVLAHPGGARPGPGHTVVAVGPEGGWDDDERQRWGAGIGLGPTVLRSETAAVAVGTVLCALRSGVISPFA
jgi:16S rRNA (uracil1498-N3)-methyltransferase